MIALVEAEAKDAVAAAIHDAGGRAYVVTTGTQGVRVEPNDAWHLLQN